MAEERNTEKRNNPKFHHKNNRIPWNNSSDQGSGVRGQESVNRNQESGARSQEPVNRNEGSGDSKQRRENTTNSQRIQTEPKNSVKQNSYPENKVESKKVETRTVETNKPETDKLEAGKKETWTVEARKAEIEKVETEKIETRVAESIEANTTQVQSEKEQEKAETSKVESKIKEQFSDKDHTQVENLDQYLDMDIRTGSNPEADAIAANIFLTRGLNEKPDVETAHCREYRYNCCKLATYDWIEKMDIATDYLDFNIAEVRFKNSHKDFFILPEEGVFHVGDIVAVEASPGHDIGIISMLGLSVKKQLEHKRLKPEDVTKKLYRTARVSDIDKWISTVDLEHTTMLSSRYIAWDLDLKMKVNDVEYQGDGTKAIFYYSAEERLDFRELIKILD